MPKAAKTSTKARASSRVTRSAAKEKDAASAASSIAAATTAIAAPKQAPRKRQRKARSTKPPADMPETQEASAATTSAASAPAPKRPKRVMLTVSPVGSDSSRRSSPESVIVISRAHTQPQRTTAAPAKRDPPPSHADMDVDADVSMNSASASTSAEVAPRRISPHRSPRIKLLIRRPSGADAKPNEGGDAVSPIDAKMGRRDSGSSGSESEGLVTPENALHALPLPAVAPSGAAASWGGKGKGKSIDCYDVDARRAPEEGGVGEAGKGRGKGAHLWVAGDDGEEVETDREDGGSGAGRLCAMCASWQKAVHSGAATGAQPWLAPADPEACETCRSASASASASAARAVDGRGEGAAAEKGAQGQAPDNVNARLDEEEETVVEMAVTELGAGHAMTPPSPSPLSVDVVDSELDDDAEFVYPDWDPSTLPRNEQFALELLAILHPTVVSAPAPAPAPAPSSPAASFHPSRVPVA